MPQPRDTHARDRGAEGRRVAHPGVDAGQRHQAGCVDEIDLVDADDRANAGRLRSHDQAVEERRLQVGHGCAAHDDHLVDVRDEHVAASTAGAAEGIPPLLDRLDHADARFVADLHPVAGGNRMPLLRGKHAQQASGGAADGSPVGGAHEALQPMDMHHLTSPRCPRDRRHGESVPSRRGLIVNDDSAFAGQVALAGNPFRRRHVGRMVGVGGDGAGEVATATARGTIFAEVGAELSGLGHAGNCIRLPCPPVSASGA